MTPEELKRAYELYDIYARSQMPSCALEYNKTHDSMMFSGNDALNGVRYSNARVAYAEEVLQHMENSADEFLSITVAKKIKSYVNHVRTGTPKTGFRIGPFSYFDKKIDQRKISVSQKHAIHECWQNATSNAYHSCIKPEIEKELKELGIET